MELNIDKIYPFVRYVHYIEFVPRYTTHIQTAYDHRIFFSKSGANKITIGSMDYILDEGSLLFIPAGVPYHLHKSKENNVLLGINFDFTYEKSNLENPIAPAFKEGVFDDSLIIEKYTFTDVEQFNAPFIIKLNNFNISRFQTMLDEYTVKRLFFNQKNSAILKEVLTHIARILISGVSTSPQNSTDKVDKIINYIQANYMHRISNQKIGSALNFHPNYLNRIMLANTGKTLHQYLLSVRLTKALDLLQTTTLSVTEIAHKTGFSDVQQFCKFFLNQTGSTPSSFR